MDKIRVLFVCIHNSARSQMAEELLRHLGGDRFEVESAGIDPGKLNPLAVETLKEQGIDISHKKTQKVTDLVEKRRRYDWVITVCDESNAERCPVFPGQAKRLHWNFEDPSRFEGSREEKLKKTKMIRDQIKKMIGDWLKVV